MSAQGALIGRILYKLEYLVNFGQQELFKGLHLDILPPPKEHSKRAMHILLSGFEQHTKLCDTPFCKKTSYAEATLELQSIVKKLVTLDKVSQRAALKACCKNGRCGGGKSGPDREKTMNQIIDGLPELRCD